jgi:hypothetical protein
MSAQTTGGNDELEGGGGVGSPPYGPGSADNELYGDAYEMSGFAKGGNDELTGGHGYASNSLYGDASKMGANERSLKSLT